MSFEAKCILCPDKCAAPIVRLNKLGHVVVSSCRTMEVKFCDTPEFDEFWSKHELFILNFLKNGRERENSSDTRNS